VSSRSVSGLMNSERATWWIVRLKSEQDVAVRAVRLANIGAIRSLLRPYAR
jgi:hypothetical protein